MTTLAKENLSSLTLVDHLSCRLLPLSPAVWQHFSNLQDIDRLGRTAGISIAVIDDPFDSRKRKDCIARVVSRKTIQSPKIVFLDPDTGIAARAAGPEHATTGDVAESWSALSSSDLLVVYQHADRTTTRAEDRSQLMCEACGGAQIKTITGRGVASDVAMLYSRKAGPLQ